MQKILVMLMLAASALFASSGAEHGGTDIVARTINFLIFAAILWYLLASPVKNFFQGRAKGISDRLNSVQDKLRESKELKETAAARVEEAKAFAAELQASTDKEKVVLKRHIMEQCEADKIVLEKQMKDKQTLAERQMMREVVESIMSEVAAEGSETLDKKKMADIIMKKVA